MLGAGQRLKKLNTQQGADRVGQHSLNGAGGCGNTKDKHKRELLDVLTVKKAKITRTYMLNPTHHEDHRNHLKMCL